MTWWQIYLIVQDSVALIGLVIILICKHLEYKSLPIYLKEENNE